MVDVYIYVGVRLSVIIIPVFDNQSLYAFVNIHCGYNFYVVNSYNYDQFKYIHGANGIIHFHGGACFIMMMTLSGFSGHSAGNTVQG